MLRLMARQTERSNGSWMQLDDASFLEASSAAVSTLNRRLALMAAFRAEAAVVKMAVLMVATVMLLTCCCWHSLLPRQGAWHDELQHSEMPRIDERGGWQRAQPTS